MKIMTIYHFKNYQLFDHILSKEVHASFYTFVLSDI
jgi:hypothetical protein